MTRVRVALSKFPLAMIAVLLLGFIVIPTVSAPPARADLCSSPPTPANPWSDSWSLAYAPPTTSDGKIAIEPPEDPFAEGSSTRLTQWYGTNYQIFAYDPSCNMGRDYVYNMMAGQQTDTYRIATIPYATASAVTTIAMGGSWRTDLDNAVSEVTGALGEGMFNALAGVFFTIAAVVAFWASRRGDVPRVMTNFMWGLAVLAMAGISINSSAALTEAVDGTVDSVVQTAGDTVPGGPADKERDEPLTGNQSGAAQDAQDERVSNVLGNLDAINRDVLYRGWLEAELGSADGVAATKYGPQLYKSTHLTYWEGYTVLHDPNGKGQEIIDTKAESFKETVENIKDEDPQAYAYINGKDTHRTSTILWAILQTFLSLPFYIIAMAAVAVALVTVRIVVMLLPVIALGGTLEITRGWFLGIVQKYSGNIVKAPFAFIGALVNVAAVGALFRTALPAWAKLFFAIVLMIILWGMVKPQVTPIPLARAGMGVIRKGASLLAMRRMMSGGAQQQAPSPSPTDKSNASPSANRSTAQKPVAQGQDAPQFTRPSRYRDRYVNHGRTYVPASASVPVERVGGGADQAPAAGDSHSLPVPRTADSRALPAAGSTDTAAPRGAELDGYTPAAGVDTRTPAPAPRGLEAWLQGPARQLPAAPSTRQAPEVPVVRARSVGTPPTHSAPGAERPSGRPTSTSVPAQAPTEAPAPAPASPEREAAAAAGSPARSQGPTEATMPVRDASAPLSPDAIWTPQNPNPSAPQAGGQEGVSEANLTYRADGSRVFQVWTPEAAGSGKGQSS